jgi:hypothetical protein
MPIADHDRDLEGLLDTALPAGVGVGDWSRVLRDARMPERKRVWSRVGRTSRRRALVFAAALITVVIAPLAALAHSEGWWFIAASAPSPIGSILTVKSGTWSGVPWSLTAYQSETQGLCVGFTPNSPSARPTSPTSGHSASLRCDVSVVGASSPRRDGPRQLAYFGSFANSGPFPGFLAGVTATTVVRVEVTFASGSATDVDTIAAPEGLGLPVRFFVIPIPQTESPRSLSALGTANQTIEQVPIPASHTHGTTTGSGGVDVSGG